MMEIYDVRVKELLFSVLVCQARACKHPDAYSARVKRRERNSDWWQSKWSQGTIFSQDPPKTISGCNCISFPQTWMTTNNNNNNGLQTRLLGLNFEMAR
jgi:hypothetical protein